MEFAIVTNTETGQRGRFPLPFQISALEEILQYERRMIEEDK